MEGLPTSFWGKVRTADGEVRGWHPLADHCADVGACCEAILKHTIVARRLAAIAGQQRLTEVAVARLAFLAALHDWASSHAPSRRKHTRRSPSAM